MISPADRDKILGTIENDRRRIINFEQSLVRIPSVNHPPRGDEKKCALLIAHKLKKLGLEVDVFCPDEVKGLKEHPGFCPGRDYTDRPNVVGVYKGSGKGRSLLLVAHTDVELPGATELWEDHDPWSGKVKDGKIFGRGSGDDKSGLTAQIMALEAIKRAGYQLKGDVILCNVVDEEQGGGNGTLSCIIRGYTADAAINMDGSNLEIQIANLGGSSFKVMIKTKEGYADIDRTFKTTKKTYQAIQFLKEKRKEAFKEGPSIYQNSLFAEEAIRVVRLAIGGKETDGAMNIGIISGWIYILPGEEKEMVKRSLEEHFKRIVQKDKSEEIKFYWWKGRDLLPSMISPENEIVKTISKAYKEVTGTDPQIGGGVMSDLYLLNLYSQMPALTFGAARWSQTGGAHQPNEYVSIEDLIILTKVTALTIMSWCEYEEG